MNARIETLIDELEQAAARLRGGEMDAIEAAALVERCAELAGLVGGELDRAAREGEREAAGGQERLL